MQNVEKVRQREGKVTAEAEMREVRSLLNLDLDLSLLSRLVASGG